VSADGRLHELSYHYGETTVKHGDLTSCGGSLGDAPPATGRPAYFATPLSQPGAAGSSQHLAYRGTDAHIYDRAWGPGLSVAS
jgi:hypothetical protein